MGSVLKELTLVDLVELTPSASAHSLSASLTKKRREALRNGSKLVHNGLKSMTWFCLTTLLLAAVTMTHDQFLRQTVITLVRQFSLTSRSAIGSTAQVFAKFTYEGASSFELALAIAKKTCIRGSC